MADPTEAEIRLQIGYAVLGLEELRELAEADATNLIGVESQLVDSLKGDYSPEALGGWSAFRAVVSQALSQTTVRSVLDAHFLNYGKLIASPESDSLSIFRDLYDYYVTNSLTVEERDFTFGSPSAGGSNVGDGTMYRLNIDENGFDIDVQTADAKTLTCIADEHSGAQEHAETFEITGAERNRDYLSLAGGTGEPGSRPVGQINALTGRDSQAFIQNPSFHDTSLTFTTGVATPASATDVRNWTPDDYTKLRLDRNTYYRDSMGEANPTSLRFVGSAYVQQNLSVRGGTVSQTGIGGFGQELEPIYIQIAYNRQTGSGDGTLTLTFGSQTASVVLAAQTGWNVLQIAVGAKNWMKTWNQEDPLVKVALSGWSTGYVLVDDVIVAPFSNFDGGWYAILGGATPFLRDDSFSFTDSVAETGLVQKWFVRGGYGYLPSAAEGAASWGDPPPTPTPTPTPTP